MSHSYSPTGAYSQMDENKQDLQKKLVQPFGLSCQFDSVGNEAFSLSERRREGFSRKKKGQRWRWSWGGGLLWERGGIVQAKESLASRAGSFVLSASLSGYLMVLSVLFVAFRHLLGTEL